MQIDSLIRGIIRYLQIHGMRSILEKTLGHISIRTSEVRVISNWDSSLSTPHYTSWWDIPLVQRRWNKLITGNSDLDYYKYIAGKYLSREQPLTALSLACGTGHRERTWAKYCRFHRCDAFDISPKRIQLAQETAHEMGLNHIHYDVRDINRIELRHNCYDVVFAEMSVHHLSNLEHLFSVIREALKSGGLFIINEFIGPSRFQWSNRQLEVINAMLQIIPRKYRRYVQNPKRHKDVEFRPNVWLMNKVDPSEAVRSSEILPLLQSYFEIQEIKGYGGAILHMLLSDIAGNFSSVEGEKILEMCFNVEDVLMELGDVGHDFAVIVCKAKDKSIQ